MKDETTIEEIANMTSPPVPPVTVTFEDVMKRQGDGEQVPAGAWADITSEEFRAYVFPGDQQVMIPQPVALLASPQGSHRIVDAAGVSHFIPAGWMRIAWKVTEDSPFFGF